MTVDERIVSLSSSSSLQQRGSLASKAVHPFCPSTKQRESVRNNKKAQGKKNGGGSSFPLKIKFSFDLHPKTGEGNTNQRRRRRRRRLAQFYSRDDLERSLLIAGSPPSDGDSLAFGRRILLPFASLSIGFRHRMHQAPCHVI